MTSGTSGTIKLYREDGSLVSTIDLAANPRRRVGNDKLHYYPVVTDGTTATIVFDSKVLEYGETYYFTLDPGVICDSEGNPWQGVSDRRTLRFTTRESGPAKSASRVKVAGDGSGDFCTIQGALDRVAAGSSERVTIEVADGTYEELVYIPGNSRPVTIRGESREGTVVRYANNAKFNSHSRAAFRNRAHGLAIGNLTIINSTPRAARRRKPS